jgi:hypothetical protein
MIRDVSQFAIIFCFSILGFGITFYGTFHTLTDENFRTPGDAFVTMFSAALGNFDMTIFNSLENHYKVFGIAVYMIFVCFITLILCNLLLAQMACTYEHMASHSNTEWRFVKVW